MNQQIPENWIKVKFKELAKEKSVRVDNPGESGYEKYVGLEHLDSGELVVKRYGSTNDVTSTMKLFEKDDILFARRNTYLRRVSVAPFDGVCSGDIIVLKPVLKHIVKGFLPIFMQFNPFENRIIALSAGAFSKRIKWKQLAEEEIVIPPIEEQKKIVETIWGIQDNIEKTEKLFHQAKNASEKTIHNLLKMGIDNKDFKDTNLGKIPKKWEVVCLGDVLELKNQKAEMPYSSEKYVALEHINPDAIFQVEYGDPKKVKSVTNLFENGDLLYGKLRPYLNKASIANFGSVENLRYILF